MAAGRPGQGHESHSQGRHQTEQRPLPLKLSAPSSPEKGSKFYPACPPGRSRLFGPHAATLRMDGRTEHRPAVCSVSQGCITRTQHQARLRQQGYLSLCPEVSQDPFPSLGVWRCAFDPGGFLACGHITQLCVIFMWHLRVCICVCITFLLLRAHWVRAPLRPHFICSSAKTYFQIRTHSEVLQTSRCKLGYDSAHSRHRGVPQRVEGPAPHDESPQKEQTPAKLCF